MVPEEVVPSRKYLIEFKKDRYVIERGYFPYWVNSPEKSRIVEIPYEENNKIDLNTDEAKIKAAALEMGATEEVAAKLALEAVCGNHSHIVVNITPTIKVSWSITW